MQAAGDAVGVAPTARWTLSNEVNMATLATDQIAAVSYGGFVAGAEMFDNLSFRVSPAEAVAVGGVLATTHLQILIRLVQIIHIQ